jgi:trk system potassium uptake protein TrkH
MNLRAVVRMLGIVLLLLAGFLLVPAAIGALYREWSDVSAFLLSALVVAVVGGGLAFGNRGSTVTAAGRPDYFRREGLAVVGLSWLVVGMAGALPYLVTGTLASWVDAFFESVSGFTTTGSTVMAGEQIDGMSQAVAFWRSFTHWLGGFGIVMVFVVLFPTGGRSLFRSEAPGISREAGHQRVRDSALGLLRIYVGISLIECALLLSVGGMGAFDAVLHTFGTIATGGFSNHSASVGYFNSVPVEMILTTFMFLCGFNFALYDRLLRVGPRPFWRSLVGSSEARWYAGIAFSATIVVATVLWFDGGTNGLPQEEGSSLRDYRHFSEAVRDASFTVVCMQTSTGYGTADFDSWPQFARVLCMFLAVIGACAGSTGGGIKMVRFMIVAKAAMTGVRRFVRPRAIHGVRVDDQSLDEGVVASVTGYFGLWVFVWLGGTLFLSAFDTDLVTAGTAVLATLNNIGPGLASVGPYANFAEFHDLVKIVLSLFMILGRLEFYALVALLVPGFWRR